MFSTLSIYASFKVRISYFLIYLLFITDRFRTKLLKFSMKKYVAPITLFFSSFLRSKKFWYTCVTVL